MQRNEGGFILEGEITPVAPDATCIGGSYVESGGSEPLLRALLDGLLELRGRRVRITVELVQHSPTDRLRDLIERFREDSDDQHGAHSVP